MGSAGHVRSTAFSSLLEGIRENPDRCRAGPALAVVSCMLASCVYRHRTCFFMPSVK